MTRKEAFKMAMDIDGHMNDNPHGIDLSWDSIEKLVNEAYAKGAAAEREACAKVCEEIATYYSTDIFPEDGTSIDCNSAKMGRVVTKNCAMEIRARGKE